MSVQFGARVISFNRVVPSKQARTLPPIHLIKSDEVAAMVVNAEAEKPFTLLENDGKPPADEQKQLVKMFEARGYKVIPRVDPDVGHAIDNQYVVLNPQEAAYLDRFRQVKNRRWPAIGGPPNPAVAQFHNLRSHFSNQPVEQVAYGVSGVFNTGEIVLLDDIPDYSASLKPAKTVKNLLQYLHYRAERILY